MAVAHVEHHRADSDSTARTDTPYGEHGILIDGIMPTAVKTDSPYAEQGAPINRSQTAERKKKAGSGLMWPRIRAALRDPISEFMGTFILILFGDGVVAQVVLSNGSHGDYQSISWGWGQVFSVFQYTAGHMLMDGRIGVMFGVYTSGISGGHINPAVTFANCVFREFPWRKFPVYLIAQILGAMAGSAVVYGNYKSAIDAFEGAQPAEFMTRTGQFFSEFIASSILMFLIYALKDDGNIGAGNLTPLALFFLIFGIGACFGWETGYAINLARDFGPRLVSYMIGYGHNVWAAGGYYFWVPMVAPFFGCTFGGFLYDSLLFNGKTPINTPYMGFYRFIPGMRKAAEEWEEEEKLKKLEESSV
ncbi:glycerol channel [Taxawa tesnikishii (nom. ined.)]|nr:glycerol channel [Dothideales sp. JES 119]